MNYIVSRELNSASRTILTFCSSLNRLLLIPSPDGLEE